MSHRIPAYRNSRVKRFIRCARTPRPRCREPALRASVGGSAPALEAAAARHARVPRRRLQRQNIERHPRLRSRSAGGRVRLPYADVRKNNRAPHRLAHAAYIFGLELSDAAPRGTVHPGCEIVSATLAISGTRRPWQQGDTAGAGVRLRDRIRLRTGRGPASLLQRLVDDRLVRRYRPRGRARRICYGIDASHMETCDRACTHACARGNGTRQSARRRQMAARWTCMRNGHARSGHGHRGTTGTRAMDQWLRIVTEEAHPRASDRRHRCRWFLHAVRIAERHRNQGPSRRRDRSPRR